MKTNTERFPMNTTTPRKSAPDAVALLKADHRMVEELFEKFEKTKSEEKKKALAEAICRELTIHAKIEEDIFYPACKGKIEDDLWHEAVVEHDAAKVLIAEIDASSSGDDFFDAKVKVLQEMIDHHVKEEEKRSEGMFAQAKEAGVDVEALGAQLSEAKAALKAQYEKEGLPKPPMEALKKTTLA